MVKYSITAFCIQFFHCKKFPRVKLLTGFGFHVGSKYDLLRWVFLKGLNTAPHHHNERHHSPISKRAASMTAAPFNIVAMRMSCPGQSTNDTCLWKQNNTDTQHPTTTTMWVLYIRHINYQTSWNSQNSKKNIQIPFVNIWYSFATFQCHTDAKSHHCCLSVCPHRTASGMATHLKVGHWALPRNTVNDSAYDATSTVFPIHPSPTKSLYWTFSTVN